MSRKRGIHDDAEKKGAAAAAPARRKDGRESSSGGVVQVNRSARTRATGSTSSSSSSSNSSSKSSSSSTRSSASGTGGGGAGEGDVAAFPGYLILGAVLIAGELSQRHPLPMPGIMAASSSTVYFLLLSLCTQYIGSHRSLTQTIQREIGLKQSALAPVFLSISLFSAYLCIKYLPDLNLSKLISYYFFLIGGLAIADNASIFAKVGLKNLGMSSLPVWKINGGGGEENSDSKSDDEVLEVTPIDVLSLGLGVAVAYANLSSESSGIGNYSLNNLLACLIGGDVLRLIRIRSYSTVSVLLIGLLFYDVFWVFGSPSVVGDNVMMSVATQNLPLGPSRLLFPISNAAGSRFPYSLLGLGDIVIPATFTSLMLRFDLWKNREKEEPPLKAGTPLFITSLASYSIGLIAASYANAVTKQGQPALLYLVPAMLGGSVLVAALRGDVVDLINFKDEDR